MKLHSISSASKKNYGKRKLLKIQDEYKTKMAKALNLESLEDSSDSYDETQNNEENALNQMINKMKEKIHDNETTRAETLQILTLTPNNWSRKKAAQVFDVSERTIRVARELEESSGVFSFPPPRKGRSIPDDTMKKVLEFYQNNENSRILHGIKDRVSIKKNVYEQKRLILCTLKELHLSFKENYPENKVGFSKFCMLRPKWCVSAGSAGTHSVCVCTIHQNVVLLLHAAHIEESYKDLLILAVCNEESKDCMLQRCSECPGFDWVKEKLMKKCEDLNEEISFNQWVSVDRTELISQTLNILEYVNLVVSKLTLLTPHHYIAHAQSSYLKQRKDAMDENTAIVLKDFSENYSFHVQDEAQGYHWTHQSCTVHPVVCYYCDTNHQLQLASLCFLSKELQHDVVMVYLIQLKTVAYLKTIMPDIALVEYFSDGCAAQYKNKKSFYNLCKHESDMGVKAVWSFFATSHGKSPCDGIGGTVKRSTAMESLRRPLENQILSVEAMMTHCTNALPTIHFVHLSKEELNDLTLKLEPRFQKASTIKGTRSFHYFEPLSENKLGIKRISQHEEFSLEVTLHSDENPVFQHQNVTNNQFVTAVYDGKWYVGMIQEIDRSTDDFLLSFMHPFGPACTFHWPSKSDICWVPFQHVLCVIDVPTLVSNRGHYQLTPHSSKLVAKEWSNFLKHK